MYSIRFPDRSLSTMSLAQMRGIEGKRIKELYMQLSEEYNIPWNNRMYNRDDWEGQDILNQAITIGNKLLYNVCHSAILAMGYSPTLGFIHTGNMRSFVYDLADLYKKDIVLIPVFKLISENSSPDFSIVREHIRQAMYDNKLLTKISKDLP